MTQGPIIEEPAQRYWRSPTNQRVRKLRIAKGALRWSGIVVLNLAVAGLLIYGGSRSFRRLAQSEIFSLERIEVEGAQRVETKKIEAELARYIGHNMLDLDLAEIQAATVRDPWVRTSTVKRVLPGTLRVTLDERAPSALAIIDGVVHLVDDGGFVIGPSGPRISDDLPVLTGLDDLSDARLIAELQRGVRLLGRLRAASNRFGGMISEMELARKDRVTVRTVSRGPGLLLDPQNVERNIHEYLALRDEIDRRVEGTKYVDLRWQHRIVVGLNNG